MDLIRRLSAQVLAGMQRPCVGDVARVFVAGTWLVHGLYNKLLGGAPRHLQIVQATPGLDGAAGEYAVAAVGLAEVAIAVCVLSGYTPRVCAATQTAALLSMNLVELTFARHLLLWPAALLPANVAFLGLAWVGALIPSTPWRARLRAHPVPVRAHFTECITLTYAMRADVLRPFVPQGLELETLRGQGFIAVALVQTRALRPDGLPAVLGQDFFLAGYRVFVTMRRADGSRLRGLRILRSDADRTCMVLGGNLLTHYQYRRCDADLTRGPEGTRVSVRTRDGGGDLELVAGRPTDRLPAGSPFTSVKEARRFAGPLPYTFDYEPETHGIVAIEARRANWRPEPIDVRVNRLSFFDGGPFRHAAPVLAAAFRVTDIDYAWKRGRRYPLMPGAAA